MSATSQDFIGDSVGNLGDVHDALHDFTTRHTLDYDASTKLLIASTMSDFLTQITNLDASTIAQNGSSTLSACENLATNTADFATNAKQLEQMAANIAKSIDYVTSGLNIALYLAKGDVPSAVQLAYKTVNP